MYSGHLSKPRSKESVVRLVTPNKGVWADFEHEGDTGKRLTVKRKITL